MLIKFDSKTGTRILVVEVVVMIVGVSGTGNNEAPKVQCLGRISASCNLITLSDNTAAVILELE